MVTRWVDMDGAFQWMDELRRRMDQIWFDGDEIGTGALDGVGALRARLRDAGDAYVVTAEVPGLGEKDVELTLHQDVLTLRGERKSDTPAGYRAHRQERSPVRFSRSFALPAKVDAEKVQARVRHGLLTVTLPKVPESQPRRIAVRSS